MPTYRITVTAETEGECALEAIRKFKEEIKKGNIAYICKLYGSCPEEDETQVVSAEEATSDC